MRSWFADVSNPGNSFLSQGKKLVQYTGLPFALPPQIVKLP